MASNTPSGRRFENRVARRLSRGNLVVASQVHIGSKPWGGRHIVDVVMRAPGRKAHLVSLKYQDARGTTEDKIFREIEVLRETLSTHRGRFSGATIVIGGEGWTPALVTYLQRYNSRHVRGPRGPRIQVLREKEFYTACGV